VTDGDHGRNQPDSTYGEADFGTAPVERLARKRV
jgi:hypothetical protein